MPFTAFIDYLVLEKKYSPHTVLAYRRDLERFLEFAAEHFSYSEIKTVNYSVIRSWIVAMVEEGISNRTINRKISSLRSYYKYLLKTKQIEAHPLAKHRALKTSKKLQVPFSEKEIDDVIQLLSEEQGFEGLRNKLIVELFYATGMRRAELVNLKRAQVSLSAKTIKVLGKRNKERIIPLLPSVAKTIEAYLAAREVLPKIVDESYLLLSKKGV